MLAAGTQNFQPAEMISVVQPPQRRRFQVVYTDVDTLSTACAV